MEERLQKYMARCGVDSRRKCEELIAMGHVEVNGEVVREPGVKIDPRRDRVRVNGKLLRTEAPAYYLHYKVKGVTTTVSDDLGRKTVMDCLPGIKERVYPVGRLDKESEGLLLLTNDGELANYITHPAHGVEKTYRVVVEGRVAEDVLHALREKGMRLGPVLIKPSHVKLVRYDGDNTVILISVSEGVNREVRRIFAALGHEVKKLLRTRVGPLELEGMKRGATRALTRREITLLRKGMEGMEPEQEGEMFPAGSARERKPTGPRGRPRAAKPTRQGKPDPALARRNPPRSSAKATGRGAAPAAGRGRVVVDDWEKRTGPGRRGRNAPAEPAAYPALGRKTLRPIKQAAGLAKPKPEKPKTAAPVKKPTSIVSHPLAAASAKPARPVAGGPKGGSAGSRGGSKPRPQAKGKPAPARAAKGKATKPGRKAPSKKGGKK